MVEVAETDPFGSSLTLLLVGDLHFTLVNRAVSVVHDSEFDVIVISAESNSYTAVFEDNPLQVDVLFVFRHEDHLVSQIGIRVFDAMMVFAKLKLVSLAQKLRVVGDVESAQGSILPREFVRTLWNFWEGVKNVFH